MASLLYGCKILLSPKCNLKRRSWLWYGLLKAFIIAFLNSQNLYLMPSKDQGPSWASLGEKEIASALLEFGWHSSRGGFGSQTSATEMDMHLTQPLCKFGREQRMRKKRKWFRWVCTRLCLWYPIWFSGQLSKIIMQNVSEWKLDWVCDWWDAMQRQSRGFLVKIKTLTKWQPHSKSREDSYKPRVLWMSTEPAQCTEAIKNCWSIKEGRAIAGWEYW